MPSSSEALPQGDGIDVPDGAGALIRSVSVVRSGAELALLSGPGSAQKRSVVTADGYYERVGNGDRTGVLRARCSASALQRRPALLAE